MRSGPDPFWLHEPNPALARALEAENRKPPPADWGDTDTDRYWRRRALNAEMEGHGRPGKRSA